MKKLFKTVIIVVGSALGLGLTLVLAEVLLSTDFAGGFEGHPTDEELIRVLEANKDEYELLISMFQEDEMISLGFDFQNPHNALTEARWNEYKRLFKRLGLESGMQRLGDESVRFIISISGLSIGNTQKGLIYRPENPQPLFDSLDESPVPLEENFRSYRQIDNDWYVLYEM